MTDKIQKTILRRVRVTGRVQGVWFRAWTAKEASARQLDGWVRNRLDGSVEALFYGPEDQVVAITKACRGGPPLAYVDDIQSENAEDETLVSGQGFVIRGSA